uniref:NADH dehydrogenase subunit 2 n=1 Tax=Dibothriocephalus dendriticus TaxID=28845 RepID=A0A8F7CD59_DIBDE|nr:NADH dehydrogenase subunit 2 [Dibothriocephalus dendriticus]
MFTRVHSDLALFSVILSIIFCVGCSLADSLLGFWVFLELAGLSIIPCFFYSSEFDNLNFYGSLLMYVVMSGLSSIFLMSGVLFLSLYYLILVGFIIKLGLFPFMIWVYFVFASSNWFFIFLISVILKFPILFFSFLLQEKGVCENILYIDCFLTIFLCSGLFWLYSLGWEYVWCHISLSSVSTLLVACFCADFILTSFVYVYYCVWAVACLCYFFYLKRMGGVKEGFWLFCFLFLITPLSLPLFYKLSVCLSIVYSSVYILIVWSLYSLSEQFFLYKLAGDEYLSCTFNVWY